MGRRSNVPRMPHIARKVHTPSVITVTRAAIPHKKLFTPDKICPSNHSVRIEQIVNQVRHSFIYNRQRIRRRSRFRNLGRATQTQVHA